MEKNTLNLSYRLYIYFCGKHDCVTLSVIIDLL